MENIDQNKLSNELYNALFISEKNIKEQKRSFNCCLCEQQNELDITNSTTNVDSNTKQQIPSHGLRQCEQFKQFKQNISRENYYQYNTNELRPNDELGFCASGVIPFTRKDDEIYILLLIEKRNGKSGLNFIAGGRECICEMYNIGHANNNNHKNNNSRPESSYETALNECEEELGEILLKQSLNLIMHDIKENKPHSVFWSGKSKIALYTIEVDDWLLEADSLVFNKNKSEQSEADGFIWLKLSEHNKYIHRVNADKITHKITDKITHKITDKINDKITHKQTTETDDKIYFHQFIKNILYDMKNLSPNKKSLNYLFV